VVPQWDGSFALIVPIAALFVTDKLISGQVDKNTQLSNSKEVATVGNLYWHTLIYRVSGCYLGSRCERTLTRVHLFGW
jgi:hypothetical protein